MTDSNSATPGADAPEEPVPGVGTISLIGRRRSMEDAISVQPNLCSPYLSRHRPVDFCAVYDGHGGPHVSGLCRDRMYRILQEELMMVRTIIDMTSGSSSSGSISHHTRERLESQRVEESWKKFLTKCLNKIDQIAFVTCYRCGIHTPCGCPPQTRGVGGSTAVLAILTEETIIVANYGDSRAVLSRGGTAIPLSIDHKGAQFLRVDCESIIV